MTKPETDRTIEVLFYLFFQSKSEEILRKSEFWKLVNCLCEAYNINSILVSKAVRILLSKDNQPTELEMYYLLGAQMKCSVRDIKRMTGIYWQKQCKYQEELNTYVSTPYTVTPRIKDITMKHSVKHFIQAATEFTGVLNVLSSGEMHKLF